MTANKQNIANYKSNNYFIKFDIFMSICKHFIGNHQSLEMQKILL